MLQTVSREHSTKQKVEPPSSNPLGDLSTSAEQELASSEHAVAPQETLKIRNRQLPLPQENE